jgi:hypothetical protein
MISVSRKLEVNPRDGSTPVRLSREQVWTGLVRKAENPVPFVEAITSCVVLQQQEERLVREVLHNGETLQELILFFPQDRVEFVRLSGRAMGQIKNIIEEDLAGNLYLRFTFDMVLQGVEPGSVAEQEFATGMEVSYLDAVRTTLRRMREESLSDA